MPPEVHSLPLRRKVAAWDRPGDGLWFREAVRGHITIYSEVGHGTTFNLYFPRVGGAAPEALAKPAHISDPNAHETILVVEDDHRVRKLTIARLKLIGCEVVEASKGPEALDF